MKTKRGLAIIYDPHNLLQFIWYYCTYGIDLEWDALCLPNGYKGEYMSEYCEKSKIFNNVYRDDKEYLSASISEQLVMFLKMFFYWAIGKRKAYCKKTIDRYINSEKYDRFVILTDHGLISSLFFSLDKEVIILEDGTSDYVSRENINILKHCFSTFDWKGFIIANMGYANIGHRYPLKTTKNATKFCSHVDAMKYVKYKELKQLNDFTKTNVEMYKRIIERTYTKVNDYDYDSIQTVLFTCNMNDYIKQPSSYIKKVENYLSDISGGILIKKHPRDTTNYSINNHTVFESDSSLPGECLLPYLKGKKLVFMQLSSILLYLNNKEYDIECLYFDDLHKQSVSEGTYFTYKDYNEFLEDINLYHLQTVKIVNL